MPVNQTGAGLHRDKRTKRNRDRSSVERHAVEDYTEEINEADADKPARPLDRSTRRV